MSTFDSNATVTVVGLENALGFALAEGRFDSTEEFEAANAIEIKKLEKALLDFSRGKKVTVISATLDDPSGLSAKVSDPELELEIEGRGHGFDAKQSPCVSFRKVRRYWLFGEKVYKITPLTR